MQAETHFSFFTNSIAQASDPDNRPIRPAPSASQRPTPQRTPPAPSDRRRAETAAAKGRSPPGTPPPAVPPAPPPAPTGTSPATTARTRRPPAPPQAPTRPRSARRPATAGAAAPPATGTDRTPTPSRTGTSNARRPTRRRTRRKPPPGALSEAAQARSAGRSGGWSARSEARINDPRRPAAGGRRGPQAAQEAAWGAILGAR